MGTLISKNKAVGTILADLGDSATNSAAKGGKVAELASTEMVPVKLLIDELDADLAAAKKLAAPLAAAADVAWQKGCDTIRLVYDLAWNHVGRPAFDPKLSVLFPGGASHYIEGAAAELPERMELLAQLFDKGVHPKLSKDYNQEAATKIRSAANEHSGALDAARLPMAKVVLLERTRTAMAQTAHSALANFKRLMKVAGFTEAQIHEIVPNRPRPAAKKAALKRAAPPVIEAAAPAPAPAPAPVVENAPAPAPVIAAPIPAAAALESASPS